MSSVKRKIMKYEKKEENVAHNQKKKKKKQKENHIWLRELANRP